MPFATGLRSTLISKEPLSNNRSHLFPVKALTLLRRLENAGVFNKDSGPTLCCGGANLSYPDDGLRRLPLVSPEIHWAVEQVTGLKYLRKRLVLPLSMELASLSQAKLEYYDEAGTLAGEPVELTKLHGTISMAVEVELMSRLLDAVNQGVPMV